MAWVVDTCLIIDVLDDDPEFGAASARLIDAKASAERSPISQSFGKTVLHVGSGELAARKCRERPGEERTHVRR